MNKWHVGLGILFLGLLAGQPIGYAIITAVSIAAFIQDRKH